MTADEVADEIRVSRALVYRLCRTGDLKAKKVGQHWRISREALSEFMAPAPKPPPRSRRRAR